MKSFFEKLKDFLKKLFIFWRSILERIKKVKKDGRYFHHS